MKFILKFITVLAPIKWASVSCDEICCTLDSTMTELKFLPW